MHFFTVSTERYLSGSFVPTPNCQASYNAPCSVANVHTVVENVVVALESCGNESDVRFLINSINEGVYTNGVDGYGFGPVVVGNNTLLADPENVGFVGRTLEDIVSLTGAVAQPDLLARWLEAATNDGWTRWIWQRDGENPDLRVGYVQSVSVVGSSYMVMSSFVDEPLVTGFEDSTVSPCLPTQNMLCSVFLTRRLVGDCLTQMMMAQTTSELQDIFHRVTFHNSDYKAGTDGLFHIFVLEHRDAGGAEGVGKVVAHGSNVSFLGKDLAEIFDLVGNTASNSTTVFQDFTAAAMNGGGWVNYMWRESLSESYLKVSFIVGTVRFGTLYIVGSSFNHVHGDIEPGPHCTECSAEYASPCAVQNTYRLAGHVQSFLLTEVSEETAWAQLTTSVNADWGLAETSGYRWGSFYPFVYNFNGSCVAHGANAAFVGLTLSGILSLIGVNTGCDSDGLHCQVTNMDGEQLHADSTRAAMDGGGWVESFWKNAEDVQATARANYILKITKYGHDFFVGVGYHLVPNPISWTNCSALYNAACSEDNVLGLVGMLASHINIAQSDTELVIALNRSTHDLEYRRETGFFLEVFDEDGVVVGHGGDPTLVGLTLEAMLLRQGSQVLGSYEYLLHLRDEGWFTYKWQGDGDLTVKVKKAFAMKATYHPRGSNVEQHFYVVSSFIDEGAPPLCTEECPAGSTCVAGRCVCAGSTPVASFTAVNCTSPSDCACETSDSLMTCSAITSSCAAGQRPNPNDYETCVHCDAGRFATAQATLCEACFPGFLQPLQGRTACSECTPGTFSDSFAATRCMSCNSGRFQEEGGASTCEACDTGRWNNSTGSTACITCVVGETTLEPASASFWDCVCQTHTYRAAGHSDSADTHSTCLDCPTDFDGEYVMDCPASNDEPQLLAGFWASAEDRISRVYSIFTCRDSDECVGGYAGENCATGRVDTGCANCDANFQPGAAGTCTACRDESILIAIATVLAVSLSLGVIAQCTRMDTSRIHLSTLSVGICFGQAAVALQTLSVFHVLSVDWVDPIKQLLSSVSVLSVPSDWVHLPCMFGKLNEVSLYAVKLMSFPVCIGILLVKFFIMARCGQNIRMDDVVNSVGFLLQLLFLTLTLLALQPFYCIRNPNGTHSMKSNPSVVCFTSNTWYGLAVMGFFAITFYCVLFCSWVVYTTYTYPRLIAAGRGNLVLTRYRFLFLRFTAQRYYFTPVTLFRSFAVATLPLLFPDYGHRQVFFMTLIFLTSCVINAWCKPWRGHLPNYLDTITTCCFLMILCCAGLLYDTPTLVLVSDLQVFLILTLSVALGFFVLFTVHLLYQRCAPRTKFAAFLCHHKNGCAAGARLMKLRLESALQAPVFLDSDQLDNLEDILETVRSSTNNLVVLLTGQTLSRPWCAGEIATAFCAGVRIICVAYDDYREFTPEDLSLTAIASLWTSGEFLPCVDQGVTVEAVQRAYTHVAEMDKIKHPRLRNRSVALLAVDVLCSMCHGSATRMFSDEREGFFEGDVVVLANPEDGEAISCAGIIALLVRMQTQWTTGELYSSEEIVRCSNPKHLCVALTKGCLSCTRFMMTLYQARHSWNLEFVTVKTADFEFPAADVLTSTIQHVSNASGMHYDALYVLYRKLLSLVPLTLTSHGSRHVLDNEMRALVTKLQRFKRDVRAVNVDATDLHTALEDEHVGCPPPMESGVSSLCRHVDLDTSVALERGRESEGEEQQVCIISDLV